MTHKRRILVLPVAAAVIAALCAWRIMNPRGSSQPGQAPALKRSAPSFQLYDQESTLVNLDAFLHRHRIVVVFYRGQDGPEASEPLVQLREFYPALKRESIIVLGVSTALPQENRNNSTQPFPFPLLSDADAISRQSAHRRWGRFIEPVSLDKPPGTKPGVFLIDRSGLVAWDQKTNLPMPEATTSDLVARLVGSGH